MRGAYYPGYKGDAMSQIPRWVLEEALWRCSKRDRELVMGWFDAEREWRQSIEASARTRHQTYRDLTLIVRDQRAHIANLEAQLLPHLLAEPVAQEVMPL